MSWLGENADELAALTLVFGGLYIAISKDFQQGMTLISIGTAYLFGKNRPTARRNTGGLPSDGH